MWPSSLDTAEVRSYEESDHNSDKMVSVRADICTHEIFSFTSFCGIGSSVRVSVSKPLTRTGFRGFAGSRGDERRLEH